MSILKKIAIKDYKNIEFQELQFSSKINCISGGNGQGKTNLLDSIWYLSMTKSSTSLNDSYNFRYGCDSFSLCGYYSMPNGTSSKFNILVNTDGTKKIGKDDKTLSKASELIGQNPIVMVSPQDIALVSDSPEQRRKFINSALSQMDSEYLSNVQNYNRYISQRNKLLKTGNIDKTLLSTYDQRIADLALPIYNSRQEFCEALEPVIKSYYSKISDTDEDISIKYQSDLTNHNLFELLAEKQDRDLILGYTTVGVHRDDFHFNLNSHPIRRCGSQGQQKSFLVALKFAQFDLMKESYGYPPILLLDDLFDKLDPNRVENLLKIVSDNGFGQIFFSDPDQSRTQKIIDTLTEDRSYFVAKGGQFNICQ